MWFKKKNKGIQDADLDCPRCGIIMKKIQHPSKATLDVCKKCGGMWLDRDEVNLLYKAEQKEEKKVEELKEKIKIKEKVK